MEKLEKVDRPPLDPQKLFSARELRMFRVSMISKNVQVKSIRDIFHKLTVICPQVFPQLISNPMPPDLRLPTVRRRRCSVSLQLAIVTFEQDKLKCI
ncbi:MULTISPECIES: hypothetical protein [unclassified Microcoleus]|uniref:hypothetical protein n=1 Tax=unclassified Microcoleus TaxID=2642155 RepID=UPI0025FECB7F|nr:MULTISPECIES: hypothetical protein [unclassified Microcoleus]